MYLYEFKKVDENGKTVLRQPAPFAKIDGSKETEELFSFSKTRKEVKIAEKKGAFHVSFGPYDPEEGFKSSSWEFACFGPGKMQLTQYPTQICGDGIAARRDELGFKDKIQAFFYDVFTNRDIAQTNPKCKEATDIMTKDCSDEGKKDAITRCYKIMDSDAHAKCANKFSCDIMDVFVDCVRFVCSSFSDTAACNRIGSSIDLCREFPGLSDKVDEANCYKDFVYRP
nr:hypothetical protein BaRGS_020553 [Batillaria attramentaria]